MFKTISNTKWLIPSLMFCWGGLRADLVEGRSNLMTHCFKDEHSEAIAFYRSFCPEISVRVWRV